MPPATEMREADVIIVGAGLSGMIAARAVQAAGLQPLILEASERVGGRILTEMAQGLPFELGAQWIGDTHERMFRLAAELGVETYATVRRGRNVLRHKRLRGAEAGRVPRPLRPRTRRPRGDAAADSTSWPPPCPSMRHGTRRGQPNGTPSPRAPGSTRKGLAPWPESCSRSARWASSPCRRSRCRSCTCCSRSRPAA